MGKFCHKFTSKGAKCGKKVLKYETGKVRSKMNLSRHVGVREPDKNPKDYNRVAYVLAKNSI